MVKKISAFFCVISMCCAIAFLSRALAQAEPSSTGTSSKAQKEQIKLNAQKARQLEAGLHRQIKDALNAGDFKKAKELKAQLKLVHKANVQQKHQDKMAPYNPLQRAGINPPGYNPPGHRPINPPGLGPGHPPGRTPGNPPGIGVGDPPVQRLEIPPVRAAGSGSGAGPKGGIKDNK